jgi:hypothetical protein
MKMKIRRYGLFFLCMASSCFSISAQRAIQVINEGRYFNEMLCIITDRDLYACGEKVWIRICKLDALTHLPDRQSKVVYIDLLDTENDPVDQIKIESDGAFFSGMIKLPDTLTTGNYMLRAHTNWMQNFSKDLFACKIIEIINPFQKITDFRLPGLPVNPDSVIFFPEGGHMVSGIKVRLGLRTFDNNGAPVIMTGAITDEKNDTLARVKTGKNGYGICSLTPQEGTRLFLVSSYNRVQKKYPLPPTETDGVVFSSPDESDPGALVILNFSSGYRSDGKSLFFIIDSPGLAPIKKEISEIRNSRIVFHRDELPRGISYLKLTDEQDKKLTDIWISNENKDHIRYFISTGKNNLIRGRIKIDILATDSKGNPVKSDFSLSVVKPVTINRENINNTLQRQMPELAAAMADCNHSELNDLLIFMRSRDLNLSINGNTLQSSPVFTPELEGLLVSGNIRDRISGEPLRKENVTLSFVGKTARCFFTKTDDNGNFNFVTKEKGAQEIVIQPLNYQRECYVDLANPFQTGFRDYDHGIFCLDTGSLRGINNVLVSMQIGRIYEPLSHHPTSAVPVPQGRNFYGKSDNSIQMSDYIALTSVREIIAELIPGVSTFRSNGKINFKVTRPYQTRPYENSPLVLVDGVPVYDLEKVIGMNAGDIEKVDVMVDRYFISGIAIDGILHFITKKGNLSDMEPDKSVFRMEYDLLQQKQNFYCPDYSADSSRYNHLPDFRNTLYWNPELRTDRNGRASVEFFSSDEAMEYVITIEGITADGITGSSTAPLRTIDK